MKRTLRLLAILVLVILALFGNAQNLIMNGDFENGNIPTSTGQNAFKWHDAGGSPDYCHQFATVMSGVNIPHHFAGYIPKAHEGIACVGFCNWMENWDNFREYPCQKLKDSLVIGQTYEFEMYVLTEKTPCIYGGWVVDDFGVLFSTVKPQKGGNGVIDWQPQYTHAGYLFSSIWKRISFTFTADSAYKYLTFGSYTVDAVQSRHQTDSAISFDCSYMYADGVSLKTLSTTGIEEIALKKEIPWLNRYNLLGQRIR